MMQFEVDPLRCIGWMVGLLSGDKSWEEKREQVILNGMYVLDVGAY